MIYGKLTKAGLVIGWQCGTGYMGGRPPYGATWTRQPVIMASAGAWFNVQEIGLHPSDCSWYD